ncbi:MAG: OmpH family outer membrane protein [Bacteroidales bacterium]|jgi:outer membrane protein|nr:OmpH family outer membrane protein [Bacteroidales bacterium]
MKNIISKIGFIGLLLMASLAFIPTANAQKFAFVDSNYILQNIPEYSDAQAQLDDLSRQWQKEIDQKFAEVEKMYQSYQAEYVLIPEEIRKQKEKEIIDAEKAAQNLQMQRFGLEGDLFKKREELIKPIQDKIFSAIEAVAAEKNIGIVFDKAGAVTMMYANVKYDLSDDVLSNMGYGYNIRR